MAGKKKETCSFCGRPKSDTTILVSGLEGQARTVRLTDWGGGDWSALDDAKERKRRTQQRRAGWATIKRTTGRGV